MCVFFFIRNWPSTEASNEFSFETPSSPSHRPPYIYMRIAHNVSRLCVCVIALDACRMRPQNPSGARVMYNSRTSHTITQNISLEQCSASAGHYINEEWNSGSIKYGILFIFCIRLWFMYICSRSFVRLTRRKKCAKKWQWMMSCVVVILSQILHTFEFCACRLHGSNDETIEISGKSFNE